MQKQTLIDALRRFAEQGPRLEFANYGDYRLYRQEARAITRDLHHARELLRAVELRDSITADDILKAATGRLIFAIDGDSVRVDYCTGQYFPTEFRPAVCRVLSSALWHYWRQTECANYDASDIRHVARRELSRAVARHYFN